MKNAVRCLLLSPPVLEAMCLGIQALATGLYHVISNADKDQLASDLPGKRGGSLHGYSLTDNSSALLVTRRARVMVDCVGTELTPATHRASEIGGGIGGYSPATR